MMDTARRRAYHDRGAVIRVGCVTSPRRVKRSVARMELNAAEAIAAVGDLSAAGPDIVCLPEGFLYAGLKRSPARERAIDAAHPLFADFSRLARELRIYLAVPLLERAGELVHNAVVFFDRAGRHVGTYRKRVLWPSDDSLSELEYGVTPGDGGGPFPTEFGPVGVQVCLETHWPAPWRLLQKNGVKLVLFASEQPGGMLLRHRAFQMRSFIASAVSKGGPSQVIDPIGNVIAQWWPETPLCTVDLALSFEIVHLDHAEKKLKALARDFRGSIELTKYPAERLCRVNSLDPGLDLSAVLDERGIASLDAYFARLRQASLERRYTDSKRGRARQEIRSVSVIVPSRPSAPELGRCLDHLCAQQSDLPYEIIVVLNGPDAPAARFERAGVKVICDAISGPARARNEGVRAASGDLLAFIDADCVASPGWLSRGCEAVIANGDCVIAGGIARFGQDQNWISLYDSVTFLQQEKYVTASKTCVTANLFMRRSLFERVGPFDESFVEPACEDWEWSLRAGRKGVRIVYDERARVHHPCMSAIADLRSKARRLARGSLLLRRKVRRVDLSAGLLTRLFLQLKRIFNDDRLGVMDRLRVMCVGAAVVFWTWSAVRAGQRGAERA